METMSAQLISGGISIAVQIVFVVALSAVSVIRAVIAYRGRRFSQMARTRRLQTALRGVGQAYRENVIRACGEFENGRSDGRH